eukprot:2303349-Amphidinium_carterae.1
MSNRHTTHNETIKCYALGVWAGVVHVVAQEQSRDCLRFVSGCPLLHCVCHGGAIDIIHADFLLG